MAQRKFHIKHIELWIIGFVLALAGAIIGITYALVGHDDVPTGVQEITPDTREKVPSYAQDFNFFYYLDNEGKNINDKYKELIGLYSDNLSRLYANTHEYKTFEGYTSISALSKNPNTDITFDKETYNFLLDAYNKTLSSNNYSVFADELYNLWNSISNSQGGSQDELDPLFNEDTQNRIDDLVYYLNDRNHVDLTFKGGYVINLKVSSEYKEYLEAYVSDPIYVGLNVLKNHYILDALNKDIKAQGYDKGYFFIKDGTIVLQDNFPEKINYGLFTYEDSDQGYLSLGKINFPEKYNEVSFNRFNLNKDVNRTYYIVTKDGIKYFRSQYIDVHVGSNNNAYLTSSIFSKGTSCVEDAFLNNELILCKNASEIRNYLNSSGKNNITMLAIFNDGTKDIYITENLYDYISLSREVDYNLIKF